MCLFLEIKVSNFQLLGWTGFVVIARSDSDEAIQLCASRPWIASLRSQ
jgi:hypothetical protein